MPTLITHCLFNEAVTGLVEKLGFQLNEDCFYWGAQGPDTLFFVPSFNAARRRSSNIGVNIHRRDAEKTFAGIAAYLSGRRGEEREMLLSYLYGFLAHYIVDRVYHPAVYGMQRDRPFQKSPRYSHRRIETLLDLALLHRLKNCSAYDFKAHRRLASGPPLDCICLMYRRLIRENYGSRVSRARLKAAFFTTKRLYHLYYGGRLDGFGPPRAAGRNIHGRAEDLLSFDPFGLFEQARLEYGRAAGTLARLLQSGGDYREVTLGINFEGERSSAVGRKPAAVRSRRGI